MERTPVPIDCRTCGNHKIIKWTSEFGSVEHRAHCGLLGPTCVEGDRHTKTVPVQLWKRKEST